MSPRTPPDELEEAGGAVETSGPAFDENGQGLLLPVPQDVGDRCERCQRRDRTTVYRVAVTAAWCDGCARAGGLYGKL